MKEKNIEKIMELWEGDHVEFPSKSNSKDIIELYIKNLCELCEYPLKEIKWINEYEKIEGLELVSKHTTRWSDFFNIFYTFSQIYEIEDDKWQDENLDVADQTTLLSFISNSVDAFGEKDGIFYCLKTKDTILNIDMKKHSLKV
jgi:hypothetical protein